ncbi:hypothetical protein GCM10023196_041100 [Actinoallomurus vinaceus]|uniref:Uncharacterized protein n=2 Tax=Actinoallomurus vinaceus TaxID=1080074 RepID=A0ABP8UC01_9ACTN
MFWIQPGSPTLLDVDEIAENMYEAIPLLYPVDTDYMILSWNRIPIAVNYHTDVYVFVYDIVQLLEDIQTANFADAYVSTGSSDFFAQWWIRKEKDELVIDSHWDTVVGNYEFLLNERSRLTVETAVLTGEWLKLLRRLVDDLTSKSVRMKDEDLFLRTKALLARPPSGTEA